MNDSSLKQQIINLEKLQFIDLEIYNLEQQLQEIPRSINSLKEKLEELALQIEKDKATYKEAEKWQKEHERAIDMQRELLTKSKNKLANSRNDREANAAQREIETIKRAISEREEESLHIMEVMEQTTESIRQKEERYQILSKEIEEMELEGRKKTLGMEQDIKKLTAERQKIMEGLEWYSLNLYEKIRQKKPRAIVAAIKGICQGCHMMLPPQTYNQLLKGDSLLQCPNCHRIVYCLDETGEKNSD